ncbi:hypothetical protein Pan54_37980 [Rubinisphaera italica]|uniref:Uncharacterized protein n=1 Tax=Rubinisphaera italica TaxID=2527969 RepID=A0A5C5XIQ6_9PLAN|nr:hypothetical protein Pan54_37980 [Rubinisphaera italica]
MISSYKHEARASVFNQALTHSLAIRACITPLREMHWGNSRFCRYLRFRSTGL